MLEPVWPDNAITTQHIPNIHFLDTKWAILMLMKLNLSPKAHIFLFMLGTKVEICLVTEKNELQEIKMIFDSLTDGCPNARLSTLFASV